MKLLSCISADAMTVTAATVIMLLWLFRKVKHFVQLFSEIAQVLAYLLQFI